MKMKENLNKNKTRIRHPEKVNKPESFQVKKPDWLKVKAPNSKGYFETKKIVDKFHNLTKVITLKQCHLVVIRHLIIICD